ncbi:MAG TPA: AI-2E family transporter, partial [Gammaproteobacteria bacterium]|nr:AI-2E family transporter [Gammaproteobacteria bacterium]
LFLSVLLAVMVWLLPLLIRQAGQFFSEVPQMANKGQALLLQLPERYPEFITREDVISVISQIRSELGSFGQKVVSLSISSVVNLLTILVYMVLVPVLIFFLLVDKQKIFDWAGSFLPRDRGLSMQVWREMNEKIAGYMRGKLVEILLVWLVTYITFSLLELHYAMLLAVVVGLSVIIPFVGAAVATVPVALIAFFQWGFSWDLGYVLFAYAVIQAIDGNLLVPLLFSEAVNLHPVAIIAAVLFFGGVWGVWGVFFAIPLATLIQAVINAWPVQDKHPAVPGSADDADQVEA